MGKNLSLQNDIAYKKVFDWTAALSGKVIKKETMTGMAAQFQF